MPSAFCYFPDARRYLLGFSRQDETLIGRKLLNDKINKPRLSLNFDSKFVRVWKVESGEKKYVSTMMLFRLQYFMKVHLKIVEN